MQLTKNFSEEEFECPCCGKVEMTSHFVAWLQKARDIANTPFRINSGWRCVAHNKAIGGVEDSSHLKGLAADISAAYSHKRFVILGALFEAGFRRIGIRETFIHVDDDASKPQGVIWQY